jgi:hypothetical protein
MDRIKLRLFAKIDFPDTDAIKKNDEIRVGKINSDGSKFMVICNKDSYHVWIDMKYYSEFVYDELVK